MNNCTISNNTSQNYGAGVYCEVGGTVNNCALLANSAGEDGGGAYLRLRRDTEQLHDHRQLGRRALRAAVCFAIMAGR